MLRALIFDFDGLILETEAPDFEAWQKIYRDYGFDLALETWLQVVGGGFSADIFDPFLDLEERLSSDFDRSAISARHEAYQADIIDQLPLMPGVQTLIQQGRARKLKLAIGSSSPYEWVSRHLERLKLMYHFDAIRTADDVDRVKPAPDLFQAALAALGVAPQDAAVFEDSAHGVTAAKSAGIFVVAVPNELTRHFDLGQADIQVSSLEDVDLDQIAYLLNGKRTQE